MEPTVMAEILQLKTNLPDQTQVSANLTSQQACTHRGAVYFLRANTIKMAARASILVTYSERTCAGGFFSGTSWLYRSEHVYVCHGGCRDSPAYFVRRRDAFKVTLSKIKTVPH